MLYYESSVKNNKPHHITDGAFYFVSPFWGTDQRL